MTDRADEIQVCTRIFEESFRHGADSEYALDVLRAYGDERAGQWVSVEERLPEKAKWSGDRVLVYTEEGYIHTGLYEGEAATEDDPWWDKFNDSGLVTHWMPLPEPPEDA